MGKVVFFRLQLLEKDNYRLRNKQVEPNSNTDGNVSMMNTGRGPLYMQGGGAPLRVRAPLLRKGGSADNFAAKIVCNFAPKLIMPRFFKIFNKIACNFAPKF